MFSGFSTRHYPYRRVSADFRLDHSDDPLERVAAGTVVRFFLGQDPAPVPMAADEVRTELQDPFGRLVLAMGHRPQTLIELLGLLNAVTGADGLTEQRMYRVADGGQIAWDPQTATLDRHLRIVITRHRGDEAELFVSSTAPFNSPAVFLQVFAWDPLRGAFNFYERRRGIWSWAGSSWQALERPTRGEGPFDSHVNGAPVMKELKLPWMHWHSQAARIQDNILAPDDPLRDDPIYHGDDLKGGEDLERIVRSGIARWTASRFDRRIQNGRLTRLPEFMRQVLATTTVNLTTSPQQSALLAPGDILRLPTTFFLNADSLIDDLALPSVLFRQKADAGLYLDAVQRHGVRLQDQGIVLNRDTHFAFAVPEPALEDRVVLFELVQRGFLSRRLAASLLMVDFPNPVFSGRRARLFRHVPAETGADAGAELDAALPDVIAASPEAALPGSAEREFLDLWALPAETWEGTFSRRIETYWQSVARRLADAAGFDAVFHLAESRRRQFRRRPLAEFGLTLSVATLIDLPRPLKMRGDGSVTEISPEEVFDDADF